MQFRLVLLVCSLFIGLYRLNMDLWHIIQSHRFTPHFRPFWLIDVMRTMKIRWFNQQHGVEMRVCVHFLPLFSWACHFRCTDKTIDYAIKSFWLYEPLPPLFISVKVALRSVTWGFLRLKLRKPNDARVLLNNALNVLIHHGTHF